MLESQSNDPIRLEKIKEAGMRHKAQLTIAGFLGIPLTELSSFSAIEAHTRLMGKLFEKKDLLKKVNHKQALTYHNGQIRELYFAGIDAGILDPTDINVLYPLAE